MGIKTSVSHLEALYFLLLENAWEFLKRENKLVKAAEKAEYNLFFEITVRQSVEK